MNWNKYFRDFAKCQTKSNLKVDLVEAVINQHKAELLEAIKDLKGNDLNCEYKKGRLAGLMEAKRIYSLLFSVILEKHLFNQLKNR